MGRYQMNPGVRFARVRAPLGPLGSLWELSKGEAVGHRNPRKVSFKTIIESYRLFRTQPTPPSCVPRRQGGVEQIWS